MASGNMYNGTNHTVLHTVPIDGLIGSDAAAVINIIIVVIGVIASILLLIATFAQRILRVPFYIVIASWTVANFVTLLTFALDITVMKSGTWPFPDFWCKYHFYILKAAVYIRLYHMPIACVVAFFSRRYLTWFKNRRWANYVYPMVVSLVIWVLFLALAAPYVGSSRLLVMKDGKFCRWMNQTVAAVVGSIFEYWVPTILSVALLIVWGFLYVRRSKNINVFILRRENCEGMVLFIIINVFVVTRLALIIFDYIRSTEWFSFLPLHHMEIVLNVVKTIANSDFVLTPILLITIVPYYRSIFCLPCRGQPEVVEIEQEPSAMPLKPSESQEKASEA